MLPDGSKTVKGEGTALALASVPGATGLHVPHQVCLGAVGAPTNPTSVCLLLS